MAKAVGINVSVKAAKMLGSQMATKNGFPRKPRLLATVSNQSALRSIASVLQQDKSAVMLVNARNA